MDTVLSDPAAVRLLSTIYRVRPGTVAELLELQALPHEQLPELLTRLDAAGLITLDGERIEALSPDHAMAATTERIVTSELNQLQIGRAHV